MRIKCTLQLRYAFEVKPTLGSNGEEEKLKWLYNRNEDSEVLLKLICI